MWHVDSLVVLVMFGRQSAMAPRCCSTVLFADRVRRERAWVLIPPSVEHAAIARSIARQPSSEAAKSTSTSFQNSGLRGTWPQPSSLASKYRLKPAFSHNSCPEMRKCNIDIESPPSEPPQTASKPPPPRSARRLIGARRRGEAEVSSCIGLVRNGAGSAALSDATSAHGRLQANWTRGMLYSETLII